MKDCALLSSNERDAGYPREWEMGEGNATLDIRADIGLVEVRVSTGCAANLMSILGVGRRKNARTRRGTKVHVLALASGIERDTVLRDIACYRIKA